MEPKKDQLAADSKVKIKIIRNKSIVEAPLEETAPPTQDAYLGKQNHRTNQETRIIPKNTQKGLEASPRANKGSPDQKKDGGKIMPEGYGALLPSGTEMAGYNDFIPDDNLPVGEVLDVNTTEYQYIGYVTALRKSVELAFYSPLSSLKDEPHIREKIKSGAKIRFSGRSVAQLTIEKSGLLSEVTIVESAGDKKIDDAWVKILNLAAPFPPLPKHFDENKFVINYSLYYDYVIREEQKMRRYRF
ncbi:energy transducer TonB [Pseudobacteriovorax antillogorgiicola]|nr:energy transducer TonB [Pseudobacteriovorax antillogorgiicola]